jgi:2'-5' RNA ligase
MAKHEDATGVSLWLWPEGEEHEALSALIARLAAAHGTPVFAPHVTLLAAVELPEDEVLVRSEALARALSPLAVRFAGAGGFDEYFRALFLRVDLTAELLGANARARAAFGRHGDPPFFPHLSLLYGRLSTPERERLRELIEPAPAGFEARRLSLVRTEGPVSGWRPIAVFELGWGERL